MKHWGSALFPLAILMALASLTFWLRSAIELPEERRDGKHRHDVDYVIGEPQFRKLDAGGRLQYTLKAVEIRHFPDDDTTDVDLPTMVYLHPKKPSLTISAERAHVSEDGEQIELYKQVRVERAASEKQAAMVATMPDLTVWPDDEKAQTASPVLLTQEKSWLKGVGMQIDYSTQTYTLESQATGQLQSKFAKKR